MFNKLFIFLGDISSFANIVNYLETLLSDLNSVLAKDPNAKNACIDAIIEVLQSHKTNTGVNPQSAKD